MKRILSIFLVSVLAFTLVACGNNESNTSESSSSSNNSAVSNDKNSDNSNLDLSIDSVKNAKETDVTLFDFKEVDGGVAITDFNGDDEIVVVPSTIEGSDVVAIDKNTFINNDTMKAVKISDKVQTIGNSAFLNCVELETAVFGSGVKTVEMYAFNGCKKLCTVELNDGLELLDGLCFGLTNITELEIPASVKEINYPFTVNNDDHYINIIGESGSVTEKYVEENGESYHLIFQAKE
ncbi:MAG: leucine-rich repeat domain-containing protein [Ruminococcus sp.]|nr:leucine-rich repeat domain-containing protein [Ruminococcus sp.]